MVGNQNAKAMTFQLGNQVANLAKGNRVDSGQWLIKQQKGWAGRQCTGNFQSASFTARQINRGSFAQMGNGKFGHQIFQQRVSFGFVAGLGFQHRTNILFDRQAAEDAGFLWQIYLPQESSIFRGLTVEQNIRAVLETQTGNESERDALLEDLMAEFAITHLRKTPSVNLSGGERRRLEIARALAARPTFLLLDEPLAGIDPIALGEIRDLIAQLKSHGLGVLITDHNVRETLEITDRATIIHEGEVLFEGSPAEIRADPDVRRVYLGESFG